MKKVLGVLLSAAFILLVVAVAMRIPRIAALINPPAAA